MHCLKSCVITLSFGGLQHQISALYTHKHTTKLEILISNHSQFLKFKIITDGHFLIIFLHRRFDFVVDNEYKHKITSVDQTSKFLAGLSKIHSVEPIQCLEHHAHT